MCGKLDKINPDSNDKFLNKYGVDILYFKLHLRRLKQEIIGLQTCTKLCLNWENDEIINLILIKLYCLACHNIMIYEVNSKNYFVLCRVATVCN